MSDGGGGGGGGGGIGSSGGGGGGGMSIIARDGGVGVVRMLVACEDADVLERLTNHAVPGTSIGGNSAGHD